MKSLSPLARLEARLALALLLPTVLIVLSIVLVPVAANFWISFKPVELGDLRAPEPLAKEQVRKRPKQPGELLEVRYNLRGSNPGKPIQQVTLEDQVPPGLTVQDLDSRCQLNGSRLRCDLGNWEPGFRERLTLKFKAEASYLASPVNPQDSRPEIVGIAENVLSSFDFTLDNYRRLIADPDFWPVLRVTFIYTIFGTLGSLFLGLFAAQLMNSSFRGRGFLRGLFLFPYVSPVIAVAFAWVFLLNPFSGTLNALGLKLGLLDQPLNLFGQRVAQIELLGMEFDFPVALTTVIVFESWRYFPLAFLFILARFQAIPQEMYEAARVDGASPFQQFFYITLPQLVGILSVMFLLRFIWTFNKFDDIFLLTGGNAGTRTLTVNVYEQGFALANLGAGSAVSVVIFSVLALFLILYFRYAPQGEEND
jgi:multiple sugar transport system permease protein